MQYIWRTLIAAVVFAVFVLLVIPALLSLINMPSSSALDAIIKGCSILIALGYILWGKPVVPGPA
jgi:Ca2+/H+ antiporter